MSNFVKKKKLFQPILKLEKLMLTFEKQLFPYG